jgi:UDP-N-acetylmuramoyl-L-alanyl-D-glutamate--2,6-diaminopimelate ligase
MFYQVKNILRKILPYRIILWTHKIRAVFAAVFYGFPARKLIIIGVAGTKGKTTVCNLIAKILEEDGKKVAMITTANLKIGKKEWLNKVKMTTPSSFFIQKFLRNAVEKKCDYAIVETTSHGLVQYRHWGIPYQIVVLTNLMPDHLDYHKTYENYRDSHLRLFNKNLKTLILNKDDQRLEYFKNLNKTKSCLSFSLKNQANFFANEIKLEKGGTNFELVVNNKTIKVNSPLLGEFNVSNCLAAVAVGSVCKINLDKIKNALEKIKGIEGRLEKIKLYGQNFEVIVDYAHSPDSLETFYKTVVPYAKGKIIVVLGACGDRDKTYRPALGKLAAKYADYVIVTNEDPYSEKPEDIIEQVFDGVISSFEGEDAYPRLREDKLRENNQKKKFKENKNCWKILDRKEAIEKAIGLAEENDLVLITGKGAEQWIVYGASGEKKVPWDDREVVREVIKEKLK